MTEKKKSRYCYLYIFIYVIRNICSPQVLKKRETNKRERGFLRQLVYKDKYTGPKQYIISRENRENSFYVPNKNVLRTLQITALFICSQDLVSFYKNILLFDYLLLLLTDKSRDLEIFIIITLLNIWIYSIYYDFTQ